MLFFFNVENQCIDYRLTQFAVSNNSVSKNSMSLTTNKEDLFIYNFSHKTLETLYTT